MNPDTPQPGKRAGGRSGARAGGATEGTSGIESSPSVETPFTAEAGSAGFDHDESQPIGSAPGATATGDTGEPRQGSRLIDQVKDKATSQLYSQKERATVGLGSVADAVRQTGRQLRDQRHDGVAEMVEGAASQIERFSNHLKDRSLDELVDDAQRLARQQPALFIGGSFAAGLIAARFIKASNPGHRRSGAVDRGWRDAAGGVEADRPMTGQIRDRGGL
jgi:hypothetical protein